MSTTPPPIDDNPTEAVTAPLNTNGISELNLDDDDDKDTHINGDNDDNKPPVDDDMFFSTMNELPPKPATTTTTNNDNNDNNDKENMDDIFRMNSPTEIKLTDDEDEQKEPFNLQNGASNTINIKPQSPSPKLSSSFTKKTKTFDDETNNSDADVDDEDKDKFLQILVSDPKKVGDGMSSYMAYTITVKTNYPAFKSTEFTIQRRFSDFLALYDKLKEKHLYAGRFLPPQPEKDMIGMARVKMSKEDTTPVDFIEKRRASLQRFLERIARHKILKYDPDFRDFLQVADGFSKSVNTSALSGAGMFKMFKSVSDQVTKIAIKMEETDSWFEERTHIVDSLHHQYKKMHSIVEMLYGWRKDLANSTKEFSKSISILSNSEEQLSLSRAMSHLGENYEKVEQHYLDQSTSDYFVFAELLKDYVCLFDNIKEVLHQRVKIYSQWKKNEETLKAKDDYKTKLENANKLDKVPAAVAEIREWTIKVEKSKDDFENISKSIKEEMKRFDLNRAKEFKEQLTKYLETLLKNQEALVKIWESYVPQVKAI